MPLFCYPSLGSGLSWVGGMGCSRTFWSELKYSCMCASIFERASSRGPASWSVLHPCVSEACPGDAGKIMSPWWLQLTNAGFSVYVTAVCTWSTKAKSLVLVLKGDINYPWNSVHMFTRPLEEGSVLFAILVLGARCCQRKSVSEPMLGQRE